ncbi:MAG: hypothetical protein P1T08_12735 [Acidimicrobiia bacterium]|nr:hypothetical protein [Acidimicrobiia bacterium]
MPGPSWFPEANRLAELDRRVRTLELAARLERASIGAGGITVTDGGKIQVLDSSGNVLTELDSDGVEVFEADGSTLVLIDGTGIRLNNSAGTRLAEFTQTGLRFYDASGNVLVEIDSVSLDIFNTAGSTLWSSAQLSSFGERVMAVDPTLQTTTSASYVTLAHWYPNSDNVNEVEVTVDCSWGDTTVADLRIWAWPTYGSTGAGGVIDTITGVTGLLGGGLFGVTLNGSLAGLWAGSGLDIYLEARRTSGADFLDVYPRRPLIASRTF